MQGITSIDYLYCFYYNNTYLSGSEVCELLLTQYFWLIYIMKRYTITKYVQTKKFKSLSIIIYLKKVLVFGLLFDEFISLLPSYQPLSSPRLILR
jgi:hypothetical protein